MENLGSTDFIEEFGRKLGQGIFADMTSRAINHGILGDIESTFSEKERLMVEELKESGKKVKSTIQNLFMQANNLKGFVLAGGCFASYYHAESIKDYDVFLLDISPNTGYDLLEKYLHHTSLLASRFKYGNSTYLNNCNTNGKITKTVFDTITKIQYVYTKFKTREELIDNFDCEHACISMDLHTDKLYTSKLSYHCMTNKIVMPHKQNTIADWRKKKFFDRGWKVPQ